MKWAPTESMRQQALHAPRGADQELLRAPNCSTVFVRPSLSAATQENHSARNLTV